MKGLGLGFRSFDLNFSNKLKPHKIVFPLKRFYLVKSIYIYIGSKLNTSYIKWDFRWSKRNFHIKKIYEWNVLLFLLQVGYQNSRTPSSIS